MQPGIYSGIPNGAYQASPGTSCSFLKVFANSPRKARFGEHKETPALEKGTLIHAAVLEPEDLDKQFCPTNVERAGTKAWEIAERMAMGRTLIKRADYEEALRIRDAVWSDPEAAQLLANVRVEQAFWWIDPETGLLCRGKTDAVNDDFQVIVDVKTTEESAAGAFRASVGRYKYHWQNAFYEEGWELAGGWRPQGFVFLALEKEPPYLVGKYRLTPDDIAEARFDIHRLLPEVSHCLSTDRWPTNREGVVVLDPLPASAHLKFSHGKTYA